MKEKTVSEMFAITAKTAQIDKLFDELHNMLEKKIYDLCWQTDEFSNTQIGELARMNDVLKTLHEDIDNILKE